MTARTLLTIETAADIAPIWGDRHRVDTDMSESDDERLQAFLILVKTAYWRAHNGPPKCWNEEMRRAINDGLISIGFGGIIKLNPAGEYFAEHGHSAS
jgi:hypothetical protein